MVQAALLQKYFAKLGLTSEVADIYIALYTYGTQTISELARNSGVRRIHIYRLLDELKASSLIEIEPHYKRNLIRAAPITNLQLLITQKEQELRELQNDYTAVTESFTQSTIDTSSTRVRFYEGIEGLRQMVWNQTKGNGENISILHDSMQHKHEGNFTFFERWVAECNKKNMRFRGIISDNFIESQQHWYKTHTNERLKNWSSRYISDQVFSIHYSMVVYDDVVLYYNWSDDQISGIEIHNAKIASMQRQLFEILWQQAQPVDDLVGLKDQRE